MFAAYRQLSRNTVVLAASIGLVLAAFFMWNPLLALHLRALGANDAEIGGAFSIFIFAHTLPAILGGMLADRFGRKWVALGPGLLLAPLYIIAGLTTHWLVLAIVLVLTNIAGAFQWPAMQALIAESDEGTRATAFSLIEIFVLSAAVIGPLLGSLLLPLVGVGGLIILHGLALLPATWVRARELRETHQPHRLEPLTSMNWRMTILPNAWWIILAYACFTLAIGLTVGGQFMSLLGHDVWSLSDQQIQQLTAVGSLASLGGVWLGGKADRWGSRRLWLLTAMGSGVSFLGWGLSPNVQIGLVFVIAGYFFFEAEFIVSETLLAQYTSSTTRSSVFGLYNTIGGITEAAGPVLGAWMVALSSLGAPFVAGAAASVLGTVALTALKEPPKAEAALPTSAECGYWLEGQESRQPDAGCGPLKAQ